MTEFDDRPSFPDPASDVDNTEDYFGEASEIDEVNTPPRFSGIRDQQTFRQRKAERTVLFWRVIFRCLIRWFSDPMKGHDRGGEDKPLWPSCQRNSAPLRRHRPPVVSTPPHGQASRSCAGTPSFAPCTSIGLSDITFFFLKKKGHDNCFTTVNASRPSDPDA